MTLAPSRRRERREGSGTREIFRDHSGRHGRLGAPAPVARPVSGRREQPGPVRDPVHLRRDQLVILPAAPSLDVRALGVERAAGLLFAVKVPRAITHDQRLVAADVLLDVFLDEARGLGERLGPLLVQLPPSLALDVGIATEFFATFRSMHDGDVVCEPRHESWFTRDAEELMMQHGVARAGADPALCAESATPGAWGALAYLRLHGSPHIYRSDYDSARLNETATRLRRHRTAGATCWTIFDNTTLGAATGNALELARLLASRQ
jgi:uncharacterized protein YecE (DUF72 family)